MRKDQQEELRRLEEALLEADDREDPEEEADQWLEEFYRQPAEEFDVYNTDDTDVELEEFSETVHQGRQKGGCLVPLIVLLTVVLCLLVGLLLWKQGVIPWA